MRKLGIVLAFVVWCYFNIQFSGNRNSLTDKKKDLKETAEFINSPKVQKRELSERVKCILSIAKNEVGVRESGGNNKGRRIGEYLKVTGLTEGYAWCAAFVCWVFEQCGTRHPASAWSPTVAQYNIVYKKGSIFHNRFPSSSESVVYVFGIYKPYLKRVGHTGIVSEIRKSAIITYEGNTNGQGSREGDGVESLIRSKKTIYCLSAYD